jgi:hypothetical protein
MDETLRIISSVDLFRQKHPLTTLLYIKALRVFKWVDLGTFLQFEQARGQDFQSEIFFVARAVGAALKDADFVVEAFDEAEDDFVFRPRPIDSTANSRIWICYTFVRT